MASKKPHTTKTFGPIHFEDLEPHRFEDLIRQLSYDHRDWQSIEATGRGGGDDGFDIRAFERQSIQVDDGENTEEHPLEGNLWMIQCKRQKKITPSQVKSILQDIDPDNPPYGYILAASANFSKNSHDVFREELREKGVREFTIWGKAALEDLLYQPRNDRLLFAFFGLSLVTRRRSKTTQVRSAITIKNRLYKLLGGPERTLHSDVLLRDINADDYPFESNYPDFSENPRWKKRVAVGHHPQGLEVHCGKFHAFVDRIKKQWDYTELSNMIDRPEDQEEFREWSESNSLVSQLLVGEPRSRIGVFDVFGLLAYDDILLLDPEGDAEFNMPHIFMEWSDRQSPYRGIIQNLTVGMGLIDIDDDWDRIEYFQKSMPDQKRVSENPSTDQLSLNSKTLEKLFGYKEGYDTLYFPKDSRMDLHLGSVHRLEPEDGNDDPRFIRVTFTDIVSFGEYIEHQNNPRKAKSAAHVQLGREPQEGERILVAEIEGAYPREWE